MCPLSKVKEHFDNVQNLLILYSHTILTFESQDRGAWLEGDRGRLRLATSSELTYELVPYTTTLY
ncbi:hypothetical protein J6590_090825 [Homalodisca vitripennis]|nr:hypothetical protein J6590_090825 [Homalodisca vitripennis]